MSDDEMSLTGPEGEPDDAEYGLVMPFVVCVTNGGELDDKAFVVGMELGEIDTQLRACAALNAGAIPNPRYLHSVGMPQLDLIAMHHGFVVEHEEWDGDADWSWVTFSQAAEPEEDESA